MIPSGSLMKLQDRARPALWTVAGCDPCKAMKCSEACVVQVEKVADFSLLPNKSDRRNSFSLLRRPLFQRYDLKMNIGGVVFVGYGPGDNVSFG